jgi:Holliday junction resolvase
MSRHTYHRSDLNQAQIIKDLRKMGVGVVSLSAIGHGVPDLLVEYRKRMYLFEVKQPKGKTRASQDEFMATWSNVSVIHSTEEAMRVLGII